MYKHKTNLQIERQTLCSSLSDNPLIKSEIKHFKSLEPINHSILTNGTITIAFNIHISLRSTQVYVILMYTEYYSKHKYN